MLDTGEQTCVHVYCFTKKTERTEENFTASYRLSMEFSVFKL